MLDDTNLGAFCHFTRRISEAILQSLTIGSVFRKAIYQLPQGPQYLNQPIELYHRHGERAHY